jgi:formylglycine-generating enzyme required for sulfatase activity
VGTYASSYYGTYDQTGDVTQWNESIYTNGDLTYRQVRGGSWVDTQEEIPCSIYGVTDPASDNSYTGFRVDNDPGGFPVPEPASLGILAFGLLGLLARRRGGKR